MLAVPFDVIPAQEVDELWPGWIARRHVTLVVAPGGTSKGLWTIDIAARVTTGKPWPGEPEGAVRPPEAVVLVAPEDDANEAVAWRLKAAGADPSLVFNLTTFADGSPFVLPDSVADLKAAIAEIEEATKLKVGLVVIDPLMATVERSLASNIAARRVINPLENLAHETGAAVILTHHTVKSGAAAGSKGLTDACRHVLMISRPDKTSAQRVVSVEKSNIASDSAKLRYTVVEAGTATGISYPEDEEEQAATRGYVIAPPLPPLAGPVKLVVITREGGKDDISTPEDYANGAAARVAADLIADAQLSWKRGQDGSHVASRRAGGGKFTVYTIFPVQEKP